METKFCSKCKLNKPFDMFGKAKRTPTGYRSDCKACRTLFAKGKRLEALTHYSQGNLYCACCSIDKIEFLALDHINGDGNKERKAVANGCSTNFYAWLKRQGWPDGYQVLCHNCNLSRGVYGYCPCQKEMVRTA